MKKYVKFILVGAAICSTALVFKYNSHFLETNKNNSETYNVNAEISDDEVSQVIMHNDYPSYNSVEELKKASNIIVECTPVQNEVNLVEFDSSVEMAQTTSSVKVSKVFKGDVNMNAPLLVNQVGGELNGVNYAEDDSIVLNPNMKYVLFLKTFDDIPELKGSPASIVNPVQGIYLVNTDGSLVSASSKNKLDVSMNNLY